MERNLDRWTIFFAIVFVLNTIVLLKIYTTAVAAYDGSPR